MTLWPISTGNHRARVEPRLSPRAASPENPSTPLSNPDAWLLDWAGVDAGYVGPPVNERTAMAVSAVFRCVALISGMIAGLPLNVYRDDDRGGREVAKKHRLYPLLHEAPYPGRPMTSFVWRELWGLNTCLWGNHYSIIRYDNAARVIGFEALPPWNVSVLRNAGRNLYRCTREDGSTEYVDQDDMLHIPGVGFNGIVGESRIRAFAKRSIGVAATLQEQVGRVHENAARPSGMVTVAPGTTPDGVRRVEAWFAQNHTGRHNAGRPFVSDNGTTYTPFQMTPEDLNTIQFLKYSNADIARFFGVPAHMIGESADATSWGSGIAQLTLGFLMYTLEPDLQRIEHELRLKLFQGTDYYPAFDRDALLAMDPAAMATVMQTRINSALITPNEGRRALRLADQPGGDTLLVNSTMVPLMRATNPPPAPAPAPKQPKELADAA